MLIVTKLNTHGNLTRLNTSFSGYVDSFMTPLDVEIARNFLCPPITAQKDHYLSFIRMFYLPYHTGGQDYILFERYKEECKVRRAVLRRGNG